MDSDRITYAVIGGEEFELILTTKATKEIALRYGGIEKLGDQLKAGEDFVGGIEAVTWLLVLLANQGIMRKNRIDGEKKRALLTEEDVEIMTTPAELIECKNAITAAISLGMRRDIRSEEADLSKNAEVGSAMAP